MGTWHRNPRYRLLSKLSLHGPVASLELGPCWEWQGSIDNKGYGRMGGTRGVKENRAHRHAYTLLVGPIPEGLTLDHLCCNKRCCNPLHLEAVTLAENYARYARMARKTHCLRGHEFTAHNTMTDPGGGRHCRSCHYVRQAEYRRNRQRMAS